MTPFLLLLGGSFWLTVVATAVGMVSGGCMLGMIALIHAGLSHPTWKLGAAFSVLCVLTLLTRIASQAMLVRLSQETVSRLSQTLCRRILDAPLRQLEEIGPHRIQSALLGDVQQIALALNGIPNLCVNVATLACGLAYLGWLSSLVVAASAMFLILGVITYQLTEARAVRYLKRARDDQDRWMKQLRSLVQGVKELKLHAGRREAFLTRSLAETDASLRAHQTAGLTLQAVAATWGRLLFLIAIGLLVFVLPGIRPIDAGTLGGVTLTILYLTGPVESIMSWLPLLGRARISLAKVENLGLRLDAAGEISRVEPESGSVPPADWSQLELVEVSHGYRGEGEDRGFQLGPIDLALRPGEIVFILGGNGTGKTTLIKLITGLYAPERGAVLLDGRPVHYSERERYRQLFSVVFAEVNLFDSLLGLDAPTLDAKARGHLRTLHLDHKVKVDAGVLSTTELSKGQRKRLALLTAYLEDRPIYVFDEWAADQDPNFKDVFYHRILPELRARGKCVVAVTHDEAYFGAADRIVRLRDGTIILDETWNHDRQVLGQSLADPA